MSRIYNKCGTHTGNIVEVDGSRAKICDEYGNLIGYIEKTGGTRDNLLDEDENHVGYIENSGSSRDNLLDLYGNYMGYTERPVSRVQEVVDAPEEGRKDAGVVKILLTVFVVLLCVVSFKLLDMWGLFDQKNTGTVEEIVTTPVYNEKQECGEGVWYILDEQGNMTISGNGKMKNYNEGFEDYPWTPFRNEIKTVHVESGVRGEIPQRAFAHCENLTSVTISGSIEVVGEQVFYECIRLKTVSLPAGVTTIEKCAFAHCKSLTSIVLPDSVEFIGNIAFEYCESLESIELGSSVEHIVFLAFHECKSLTSIRLPKTLKRLDGVNVFQDTAITDIYYEGSESEWRNITYLGNSTVGESMREFTAMGITVHYNAG